MRATVRRQETQNGATGGIGTQRRQGRDGGDGRAGGRAGARRASQGCFPPTIRRAAGEGARRPVLPAPHTRPSSAGSARRRSQQWGVRPPRGKGGRASRRAGGCTATGPRAPEPAARINDAREQGVRGRRAAHTLTQRRGPEAPRAHGLQPSPARGPPAATLVASVQAAAASASVAEPRPSRT